MLFTEISSYSDDFDGFIVGSPYSDEENENPPNQSFKDLENNFLLDEENEKFEYKASDQVLNLLDKIDKIIPPITNVIDFESNMNDEEIPKEIETSSKIDPLSSAPDSDAIYQLHSFSDKSYQYENDDSVKSNDINSIVDLSNN